MYNCPCGPGYDARLPRPVVRRSSSCAKLSFLLLDAKILIRCWREGSTVGAVLFQVLSITQRQDKPSYYHRY